jgi:hypothetical protein
MKAIMARTEAFAGLDPERRIGGQTAALGVEFELENQIRAGVVARRLQNVVVEAGDVRHEGEFIGGVGLNGVRAGRGFLPVNGWGAHCAVPAERMNGREPALVVGTEQIPAGPVGG